MLKRISELRKTKILKRIGKLRRTKILEITLLLVISGTMVSSFVVSKDEISKETSTETSATPASGKVVILDAGHGGEDRWSSS